MAIDDVQFPAIIARGAQGGPRGKATIIVTAGGGEQRIQHWSGKLGRWDVASGLKRATDLATLQAFFRAREANVRGFRFKDWSDYRATDQAIGTGNGATTVFQLVKTYTSGGRTVSRTITRPVAASLVVKLAGVVQPTGWTLGAAGLATGGKITFAVAPGSGVAVSASFEFDVPARFDAEHLDMTLHHLDLGEWRGIPVVEIPDE